MNRMGEKLEGRHYDGGGSAGYRRRPQSQREKRKIYQGKSTCSTDSINQRAGKRSVSEKVDSV